jgi:GNAT superfamily N-acetyltransferase
VTTPLPKTSVRAASADDAEAVAELLGQLGYPTTAQEVIGRLANLRDLPSAIALVAETDGLVTGVVTGHLFHTIHSTPLIAWLTTLVVRDSSQHSGIGRQLAAAVEDWAQSRGALRISVTSGKHRDGAHAFYEHIGYERTGLRLSKSLA